MSGSRTVLCGANAYDKKYFFNKEFAKLPQSIQEELHIICVRSKKAVYPAKTGASRMRCLNPP